MRGLYNLMMMSYTGDSDDGNDKHYGIVNLFDDYPLDKHLDGDFMGETTLIKLIYLIFPLNENIKNVLSNLFHSTIKSKEEIRGFDLNLIQQSTEDNSKIF